MKSISIKIDENTLLDAEKLSGDVKRTRNSYINEAIVYYNKLQAQRILSETLRNESFIVREESLRVLSEFELIYILPLLFVL